jgi:hypothetical protein
MRFLPLAAVMLMAACGTQTALPSASATPRVSSSAPVADRPAGLRGLLLTADELPAMHGGTDWRVKRTAKEGDQPSGRCQLTSLTAIGATSALVRTFSSAGSDDVGAAQVVAEFADAKSAWRSLEVLKSWRDKCAARLGAGSSVSSLATVGCSPATGHRYLVGTPTSSTTSASKAFEGIGLVRRGSRISIVLFSAHGSSYTYPVGREPETRAVKAIAQLLG